LRQVAEALTRVADGSPGLRAEVAFYRFAHGPANEREPALKDLHRLIVAEGDRSPGWDLSDNVRQAVKDGHSEAAWLPKLASVIVEDAELKTLEDWPAWREAASAPA
jgi:hypothetical protein